MEVTKIQSRRDGSENGTKTNLHRDERSREKERNKDRKEREKLHEKEKRRRESSCSSGEDEKEHEMKKSRREEGHLQRKKSEKTQEEIEEEMVQRRRRVEEWQEWRRKEESEKEKRRRESSCSSGEDEKEHEMKKSRREEEHLQRKKSEKTQEEIEEEMVQRRRRVEEWQEWRRKEESEKENPESGRTWTLDGESDDEEEDEDENVMSIDYENGAVQASSQNGGDHIEEEEIDPLDAFMNSVVLPEVKKLNDSVPELSNKNSKLNVEPSKKGTKTKNKSTGRIIPGENSDSDFGDLDDDEEPDENDEFMRRVKKTKVEKLSFVDHSKIEYPTFRKNFYIESKEISRMTSEEVAVYRKQLKLKLHGEDIPKPVKTWQQTGLTTKIHGTIRKLNFDEPMSIQAQALPIIMSGRDCIGIAKTGSGKTLAFVLPMLRHILDQPELMSGDGPIGLVLAPTRELVQQIHSVIKKFTQAMGLSCVPVYGGSGVAQQISDLKRGAEIVVCTPGRMIDILCTSGGKITNLRRVTYLVMDEADRMFDMGFEPQIAMIVQNTRPDRQTVLFSATFPRRVETLARKVLKKPVEIQVGGRSVVNKDITQLVEFRPESDRFLRLLELLGEWCEKGKILIFVQSQDKRDSLFKELIRSGYPCLSLHGAKDQTDRKSTIADFKSNMCNVLIATSIAARGIDVKDLKLVINYDVPNHYEDYVHRVGRMGRAGQKGCAITFVCEDDARYARGLVKALELSEQSVPDDLKALADRFMATGNGGSKFKIYEDCGVEEDESDSDDEDDGTKKVGGDDTKAGPSLISAELEINDFPQDVRWMVTHKETLGPISKFTGAVITIRGQFFQPGRTAWLGERKLYLFIEGRSEACVNDAKKKLKRVLEDIMKQGSSLPGSAQHGRYSIV